MAPQLSSKRNERVSPRVCLRAIAAAPGNTIVYCVHFSPSLPGDSYLCEPQARCLLFIIGAGGVGLLLSLPQTCREILLVPADARFPPHRAAPHRTAPPGWLTPAAAAAAVIEGRGEKNKRGAFSFQPPRCNNTNGVCISPLLAASTNHVAFYSSIMRRAEEKK